MQPDDRHIECFDRRSHGRAAPNDAHYRGEAEQIEENGDDNRQHPVKAHVGGRPMPVAPLELVLIVRMPGFGHLTGGLVPGWGSVGVGPGAAGG